MVASRIRSRVSRASAAVVTGKRLAPKYVECYTEYVERSKLYPAGGPGKAVETMTVDVLESFSVADQDRLRTVARPRELQPGILVNDRLGIPGDFVTPEQYQPAKPMEIDGRPVPWEACQTLNGSWGYFRDNQNDKPVDLLVRMLVDGVSKNGNLLLNVGPTGRGNFDPWAV